jgi:hypothetical protein
VSGERTTDPRHPSLWWRENWQLPQSWSVCSRCGIQILRSHLDNGVCRDVPECDEKVARSTTEGGGDK